MTTITFHWASLLVGLGMGFVLGGFVFVLIMFGERWSAGFSDGWKCGKEYAEEKEKRE